MLIDWFTVSAQIVNFLVLVWLLKRFLYKPILSAIDTREKGIAAELKDVELKRAEACRARDEFQKKNEDFDRTRAALWNQATEDAKTERQQLLDDAQKAADVLRAKRQEALINESTDLSKAILEHAKNEVFAVARKALTDLATRSLEVEIVGVFNRRLCALESGAKSVLSDALNTSTDGAIIYSAFEVPPDQRIAIQRAINETFAMDIHLRFLTDPELIAGIEMSSNGQKLAWSISGYLANLQLSVEDLIKIPTAAKEPKDEPVLVTAS